jgi:hypothetical protein
MSRYKDFGIQAIDELLRLEKWVLIVQGWSFLEAWASPVWILVEDGEGEGPLGSKIKGRWKVSERNSSRNVPFSSQNGNRSGQLDST